MSFLQAQLCTLKDKVLSPYILYTPQQPLHLYYSHLCGQSFYPPWWPRTVLLSLSLLVQLHCHIAAGKRKHCSSVGGHLLHAQVEWQLPLKGPPLELHISKSQNKYVKYLDVELREGEAAQRAS